MDVLIAHEFLSNCEVPNSYHKYYHHIKQINTVKRNIYLIPLKDTPHFNRISFLFPENVIPVNLQFKKRPKFIPISDRLNIINELIHLLENTFPFQTADIFSLGLVYETFPKDFRKRNVDPFLFGEQYALDSIFMPISNVTDSYLNEEDLEDICIKIFHFMRNSEFKMLFSHDMLIYESVFKLILKLLGMTFLYRIYETETELFFSTFFFNYVLEIPEKQRTLKVEINYINHNRALMKKLMESPFY